MEPDIVFIFSRYFKFSKILKKILNININLIYVLKKFEHEIVYIASYMKMTKFL